MVGTTVYDKDGVSAAAVFAKFAANLYESGSLLSEYLDGIYKTCVPNSLLSFINT